MADTKEFFRFYENVDKFEETRPMYEKIIKALAEAGYIPDNLVARNGTEIDASATLDAVVGVCRQLDDAEVARTGEQVKEGHIGLLGFFNSIGTDLSEQRKAEIRQEALESLRSFGDIDKIKKLLEESGYNLEELLESEDVDLEELLTKVLDENTEPLKDNKRLKKFFKGLNIDLEAETWSEMGEKALEYLPEDDRVPEGERESHFEAKAFLGQLRAGPFFTRLTCASAAHMMGKGRVMQIGCSQGKTTVVAMTTYEQFKQGKKVFSTSSSPGLVPENYDEARTFYEQMGVAEDFCSISQNANDNVDHIILFHNGKKYEVRAGSEDRDVEILVETPDIDENGRPTTKMLPMTYTREQLVDLGLVPTADGKFDFEASVQKMFETKGIIMGDTITLGKYQHLMPKRNEQGAIPDSFLIVDEADAELLDTHPQEILGRAFTPEEAAYRAILRRRAHDYIAVFNGDPAKLEQDAEENGIPYEFLLDAYDAKMNYPSAEHFTIRDGKMYVLNPSTNVMIPASQGVTQAILAANPSLGQIPEREVIGVTDIPKLFSNFETASLMSGTMQDKGMDSQTMTESYRIARKNFLEQCGRGVGASIAEDVIDWRLVTPMTREQLGNAIVTPNGIKRNEDGTIETEPQTVTGDWREALQTEPSKTNLENQWRAQVRAEAELRSSQGRPVMVSVYGNRNPVHGMTNPINGEPAQSYTDKNQIAQDGDIHKIGSKKCLFVRDGKGEIATFDDFYGRGYTFVFAEMESDGQPKKEIDKDSGKEKPVKTKLGGHVLITSFPQNSRNLEQFLFRVARGGDKGSSSMIISPTDPVIVDYLEKLEAEQGRDAANAYFQGIMSGEIKIDDLIRDIYPKETEKIFMRKTQLARARKIFDETEQMQSAIVGEEMSPEFTTEFEKRMAIRLKGYRLIGTPGEDEIKHVSRETAREVRQILEQRKALDGKEINKPERDIGKEIQEAAINDNEYNRQGVKQVFDQISMAKEQANHQQSRSEKTEERRKMEGQEL